MKNVPYAIFDHGAVQALPANCIVFADDIPNFNRDAKELTVYGDVPGSGSNDEFTLHINEAVKRKIPNPTGPDVTDRTLIVAQPPIILNAQSSFPVVLKGSDYGGYITSVRISNYGGGANECTFKIS
tara:strand:- start:1701 stop:2081 length:381 start_codon:yes stop_codon:yes gene_type:complete